MTNTQLLLHLLGTWSRAFKKAEREFFKNKYSAACSEALGRFWRVSMKLHEAIEESISLRKKK